MTSDVGGGERPKEDLIVRQFRRIRRRSVPRLAAARWGGGGSVWESDVEGRALVVDRVDLRTEAADQRVTALLGLAEDDADQAVVVRSRRFVLDGKPVLLSSSYLPAQLVNGSPILRPGPGPGGIYARLADLGQVPAHFREDVLSRMPTHTEGQDLEMVPGTPVFLITCIAYTAQGRAVEANEMVLDASAYVLEYAFDA